MADDNKEVKAVVSEITSVGTDEGQKAPDVKTKRKKSEPKRASKATGKEKPPSDDEGEADEADKAPKAGDDKEKEEAKEGGAAEGEAAKEEGKEGGEEAKGEDQEKKEGAGKEEEEAAKEVVEEAVAEAATGAPAGGEEGGEQEGGDDMEVDTTYDLIPIRTVGAARAREDGQDEGADEGTEPESPEDEELRALLATDPKTLRPQRLFDYWRRLLELQYGDQVAGRFDDPTEEVGEFEEGPEEIVKEMVEKAPSAVEVRKSRSRSSALAARVSRTALAARQQSRSSLSARPSATATSKQSLRGTRLSESQEPRASESAAGGRASLSAQGARSSTGAGGPRGSEARPSTTEGRPSTTDSPRGSQAKEGRKSRGSKRASKD